MKQLRIKTSTLDLTFPVVTPEDFEKSGYNTNPELGHNKEDTRGVFFVKEETLPFIVTNFSKPILKITSVYNSTLTDVIDDYADYDKAINVLKENGSEKDYGLIKILYGVTFIFPPTEPIELFFATKDGFELIASRNV